MGGRLGKANQIGSALSRGTVVGGLGVDRDQDRSPAARHWCVGRRAWRGSGPGGTPSLITRCVADFFGGEGEAEIEDPPVRNSGWK